MFEGPKYILRRLDKNGAVAGKPAASGNSREGLKAQARCFGGRFVVLRGPGHPRGESSPNGRLTPISDSTDQP
jgi:hypothetical protein